ncbi:hypothetical protein FHS43_003879 [Streptosporangium becharense]|uniref:Uncharacterized protein n=1 Tax=Streptosporangium becharense TaxID=1816182 RepID=A0A7W9MHL1_9ACTN|nr:hypothetical protein [Streptosporangium becharense]MBB2912596.1 hypothetical protein [Streptosporangium becharense]MBB5820574.1 hypothetical protein [Streptosporangium becharense]
MSNLMADIGMNGDIHGEPGRAGPDSGVERRATRHRPGRHTAVVLLIFGLLGSGFLYLNRDDSPQAAPDWKPGPFDPPVQYAFTREDPNCHSRPREEEDDAAPEVITCSEWTLRVNYKRGKGRQDLDITYGASCGGFEAGSGADDDECSSDIPLLDAVSQAQIEDSHFEGVPLRITAAGHHLAYFSKQRMQFVGWNLPTARLKPISPRLDAEALGDVHSLEISPDGRFFALAFSGDQPRLLITEFATGRTSTFPGFCHVLGLSHNAAVIAAKRACPGLGEDDPESSTVTILNHRGMVTSEWKGGDFINNLSPDGRLMVKVLPTFGEDDEESLAVYNAKTGKIVKKFNLRLLSEPSDAIGYDWLDTNEYIIEAEPPEPGGSFGYYKVNVQTGKSQRIRDIGLDPGATVSLGKVHIGN